MSRSGKERWKIAQGFIYLAIIIFVGIMLLRYLGNLLITGVNKLTEIASGLDAVVIVALISGVISILGVVVSSIVSKVIEYQQKTKRYLFEKREKPYSEFVEMVYKLTQSNKLGISYDEQDMLKDMMSFSRQLTLWGSSRVIRKWLAFRESSQNPGEKPTNNLFVLEDIIFEIRKDMGQKRKGLKKGDLLAFFVNDIKSYLPKK